MRLAFQATELSPYLGDDIAQPDQVLPGRIHLAQSGFFACFEFGDPGRFLDQGAALFRLGADQHAHLALLNDRVGTRTDPGIHKQLGDVEQATGGFIDQIFAVTVSVKTAGYHDFSIIFICGGADLGAVVEDDGDLRHAVRLAALAAAEDDIFHRATTQLAGVLFTHDPADGVDDIAFPAAVRSNHTGDSVSKVDADFIDERFKSDDVETLDLHVGKTTKFQTSKQKRARHVIRGSRACKASAACLCRLPVCGRGVIMSVEATGFRRQPIIRSAPMNSTVAKFFRRALYFLLLLIAVLVILGSIILSQLDLDDYRHELEIELSAALEQPVSIGRSKLTFNNGIALRFQDLQIGPKNALLADIPYLTATLEIGPLLNGEIYLNRVVIDQPQLQFWFPILNRPEKGTAHRLTDQFGIRILTIRDASIRLHQRRENDSQQFLHLNNLQIELYGWQPGQTAELIIGGLLQQQGKPAEFLLDFVLPSSTDPAVWRQQNFSHLLRINNLQTAAVKPLKPGVPGSVDLEARIEGIPAEGAKIRAFAKNRADQGQLFELTGLWQSSVEQDAVTQLAGDLLGLPLAGEFFLLHRQKEQFLAGRFGAVNVALTPELLNLWQLPEADKFIAGTLERLELVVEKTWPAGQPLDSLPRVGAEFTIADLEWSGNSLHRIQDFSAVLSLDNQQLDVRDGILIAAQQPVFFSGRIESLFAKPRLDFKVELQAQLQQLGKQLSLPDDWQMTGPLTAGLTLSGPAQQPRFKLQADLSKTHLSFGQVFNKPQQQKSSLRAEGLIEAEQLQLDRLDWQLPGLLIRGNGIFPYDPGGNFFLLDIEPIQLAKLQPLSPLLKKLRLHGSLHPTLERSDKGITACLKLVDVGADLNNIVGDLNGASGQINIGPKGLDFSGLRARFGKSTFILNGQLDDWQQPQLDLQLQSAKVRPHDLIFRNQKLRLYDLKGRLLIDGQGIAFDQVKVRVEKETEVVVDGVLDSFSDPQVRLDIDAKAANIDHVIQLFVGPQKVAPKKQEKPGRPLLINARVEKGSIGDLRFSNASGVIKDHRGIFTIYPLRFDSGQGSSLARVEYDRTRQNGMLKISGHAEGIDATVLHQDLFKERGLINGPLNGNFYLEGSLDDGFWQNAVGGIHLKVEKGTLRKFRGLARVFSLLNVSQLFTGQLPDMDKEGMPFSLLEGSVRIADGRAYTEDMRVFSEAMNLSLVGSQSLIDGSLDYHLGVMPLRTVDKVISSIPVAGWVLAGEDKALLTAHFKVEGPSDAPKVSAIPASTVSDTVFGIFKRTLGLPGKIVKDIGSLFKKTPEKKKESTD